MLVACAPSVAETGGGSSSSSGGGCVIGEVACECTAGGGCDPGLQCVVGVCIPEDLDTSITDPTPPDTGEVDSTPPDTSATEATTTSDPTETTDAPTSSSADESSSTEGPPSPCGNGRLEDDEVCDDGNAMSGDGCNADCQPGGQEVWTVHYDGGLQLEDYGQRVATDADDDVIVVGMTRAMGQNQSDAIILKLDDDGQVLWDERYDGETGIDYFWGVAILPDQSIVATGATTNEMGAQQPIIVVYDEDGDVLWTHIEPDAGDASANDVVVDSFGDIVVTGYVRDPDTFERRAWLAKFSGDGDPIWDQRMEVPVGQGNLVLAIHSDDTMAMAGGDGTVYVRTVDPDGEEIWTWTESVGIQGGLFGAGFASDGDVIVAGLHMGNPAYSYLARHPDDGGDPLWVDSWIGALGGSAISYAAAVDGDDRPVHAGLHSSLAGDSGIFVRKHEPDGDVVWVHAVDPIPGSFDYPSGVTTDSQDYVIVSGRRTGDNGNGDMFIRKVTP